MLPAFYNLDVWAGATYRKVITLLQGNLQSPPQDLTGYTAEMDILDNPDGNLLYSLTTGNGGINLGASGGTIALYIPASVTATWEWSTGVYTLVITDAGNTGDIIPLLWGRIIVKDVN